MSLAEFESKILKTIDAGDLNSALNLIIHFADKISYGKASVITMVNVFGSVILDQLCQRIGSELLKIQAPFLENQHNPDNELIIYIATQLYITGGHTAVIEDLIKARPEKKHLILITDTFNSTDRPAVEDRFSPLNVQISWAIKGTAIDKLRWLQQALMEYFANQIFLFNHPQDAVAVAAVQPNLTPNLFFYHHAGHLFCLGVYLSYAQHIDSDPGSFYNCRNNLGIANNIYLPLVVDNIPDRCSSFFVSDGQLRTCSSGSENKFIGTPYLYSYIHEVPKIIASTGGSHIHVGYLSQYTLSLIERGLGEFRISLERFIHIPWVKSLGRAMHEHKVDIYLESFPLGGGRAGIEVMASATPMIVHNNYHSRQLCSTDITYPEAFRWQIPEQLYRYLRNISSEVLKIESVYSRKHYEKNHIPKILPELLTKIQLGEATPVPPELKPYYRNNLQSFFDQFFYITNPSVIEDVLSLGIQNNQSVQINYYDKQQYPNERNIRTKVEREVTDALSGDNTKIHNLRKQIAEQCLNITDEQIADMYAGLLGKTHKMLLSSGTNNHSLSKEEETFVNEIVVNLSQGLQQPRAIQFLLAAMLYCEFNQLPIPADFSDIPEWLLYDYLEFCLSYQGYFKSVGEAEKFCHKIEKYLDNLHSYIFNNTNSTLSHKITNYLAQRANFIPLYFNEVNLKDIYVKRAEIIEYFLKLHGYEIDYEFTDRLISRKKIRLGILANSFLPSAETYAYLPVYEYLSRDFEVILYSLAETGHPLEQYCQLSANSFKLLPQELSAQVNIIRGDDVDILFIATNVTAVTNQICLLATHRLARIQVTSGGSVVTTGMRNIDYYISGTLTDLSPTAQDQYQEKLIKLEGSAHCFSYGTEEGKITTPVERNNLGIPEDAFVFISCANYFKTIPELVETWAKIISQVPNSVLVLLPFGPNWSSSYPKLEFINHLKSIFTKYELVTERLIVLDPQPVPDRQDMKEYYKIADIYLDSFPFAGTTSLIEPLQVNLPVIARQGNNFRSTMGAAMIQTLNIPGLVGDSEESYIKLAVELGNNPELRQQKSDEIQDKMQNNPSFLDSRAYSAKMGNLFQELFRNYLSENLVQNLRLRDINLIIFPDWTQSEDELGLELQEVIQALATHPENEKITLIIHTGNITTEDAEMFLSSVAMNLLMEDLDISDTIDISLLDKLGDMQWQSLLPRIYGRVILDNEDKVALTQAPVSKLESYQLDSWMNQI